jgi:ADP-ribose pyrophosphatase YjhB (NUDIX family)
MVNGRPQVMAARRTRDRSLFPGKWACGGGMVRPGESVDPAIQHQIFEELGLEIERVRVLEA